MKKIYLVIWIVMCAVIVFAGHMINVSASDNDITAIQVDDVTVYEKTNGNYNDNNDYIYGIWPSSFTVTYADGTGETQDYSYFYNLGYDFQLDDPQNAATPTIFEVNNSYTVTLHVTKLNPNTGGYDDTGVSTSYSVNVLPFPFTSIKLESTDPIFLREGVDGYVYTDPDNGDSFFYYYVPEQNLELTLAADNSTVFMMPSEIASQYPGLYPSLELPAQSFANQLSLDTPYTNGSITFGPLSASFSFMIESSPVQSISVQDFTLIELLDASLADDWNGGFYPYYSIEPIITVSVKNGESIIGTPVEIANQFDGAYPDIQINGSQQDPDHQLSSNGSPYTMTVCFRGKTATASLIFEPCPYAAISAEDIVLTQNVDGYQDYDETGNPFFHYIVPNTANVILTDTNSSSETKTIDEWNSELQRSIMIEIPGQSSSNELTAGTPYVANVSLGALTGTCNVILQSDPNVPQSISMQDLTLTELLDAYLAYDQNGVSYPYYPLEQFISLTAIDKDGNELTGTPSEIASQFESGFYDIQINGSPQGPDNMLSPSTTSYTMTVSIKGVSASASLTIEPCPFTAISAAPVTATANTDVYISSISEDYLVYSVVDPDILSITLTKGDGTTISGTPTELSTSLNLTQFFTVELYQPNNGSHQISPGTYQATIRLGALTNTFDLTIEPNAIQDISVDDIIWTQNQTGNWDTFTDASGQQVQYWKYPSYYDCLSITVHYQDHNEGLNLSLLEDQFGEKASFDYSQNSGEAITPGEYTVHMTIAGITAEFHITVYASIQSITIDDYALTQYFDARWIPLDDGSELIYYPVLPPSMRVTLTDGTEIYGSMYELQSMYGWGVNITDGQSYSDLSSQWEPGEHVCSFSGMGFQGTFTVTLEATAEEHKFTRKVHEDEYILYPATCMSVAYYLYGCEYHDGEISTCPGKYYYLYDTPDMNHYSDYYDPNNHFWSEWEVVIPATETTNGLKRRICNSAGHKEPVVEEEVIPAGSAPANGYEIIEGGDATYYKLTSEEQNNSSELTIVSDAPMGKYTGFYVDGQLIDPYYIASIISGSTRVTLTSSYLRHLEMGTHFVTIVSSDGSCTTTLTLATRPIASQVDDDSSQSTEDSDSSEPSSQTDDDSSKSSSESSSEPEKEESSSTPTESSSQESSGNSTESSSKATESESSKEESSSGSEQSKNSETSQNSSNTSNSSGGETSGGSGSGSSSSAATGDNTNIVAYVVLLLTALVSLMVVVKKKKELN